MEENLSPTIAIKSNADHRPVPRDAIPPRGHSLPERMGSYLIRKELGRGGMGIVYEGFDPILRRRVAIKVLRDTTDHESLQRFRREAEAVAQLQHSNIVQIYEVGWHEGLPYVALEYLPGGSLDDRIAGQPKPPRAAAERVRDLAMAVAHAHSNGVVHRDLKPANILFSQEGTPKINDFGVARLLHPYLNESDPRLTQAGTVIGTPHYMAPEQAAGASESAEPAIDIYALGAILYELLTGRPPFTGVDAIDIMQAVRTEEPVSPRKLQPKIPRDLETICLKCLEKLPSRRYESAADLTNDLNRFLAGESIKARPSGLIRRGWMKAKRHPAPTGAIVGILFASVIGLSAFLVQYANKLKAYETAKDALDKANLHLDRANWNRYRGTVFQAQLLIGQANSSSANDMLDDTPESYRNWEWHYVRQQANDQLWVYQFPKALNQSLSWATHSDLSPDGRYLAVAACDPYWQRTDIAPEYNPSHLSILDTSRGEQITYLHQFIPAKCQWLSWADEDRLIICDYPGDISVWSVREKRILERWMRNVTQDDQKLRRLNCHLSDNRRWIVRNRFDAQGIEVIDTTGKTSTKLLTFDGRKLFVVEISPDGRHVIAQVDIAEDRENCKVIFDRETGKVVYKTHEGLGHPRFSPNGHYLATNIRLSSQNSSDYLVIMYEVPSFRPAWKRHYQGISHSNVYFTPDSRRVGFLDSLQKKFHFYDTESGDRTITLLGHESIIRDCKFSPDSRYCMTVSDDQTVRIWDHLSGKRKALLSGHRFCVQTGHFSPDGRSLFTSGSDERVIGWDLTRHRPSCELGQPLSSTSNRFGTTYGAMIFNQQGKLLSFSTCSGIIEYEPHNSNPIRQIHLEQVDVRDGKLLSDYCFSASGHQLAGRTRPDTQIGLWDTDTGKRLRCFDSQFDRLYAVAFSGNGKWIACSGVRGKSKQETFWLQLWNAQTGERVLEQAQPAYASVLKFAPDQDQLAIGYRYPAADGPKLRTIDFTGKILSEWSGPESSENTLVSDLLWLPGGQSLAISMMSPQRQIIIWDLPNGREIRRFPTNFTITSMILSPDRKRMITQGYGDIVTLYDTESWTDVATLKGSTGRELDYAYPGRVAMSADGHTLAASHWDGKISIWHVDSFDIQQTYRSRTTTDEMAFRFHLDSAWHAMETHHPSVFHFHLGILSQLTAPTPFLSEKLRKLSIYSSPSRAITPWMIVAP